MAKYVKKYPDENRGRPATGRRATQRVNVHLDIDVFGWLTETRPESVSMTKYINDIIRKEAGL